MPMTASVIDAFSPYGTSRKKGHWIHIEATKSLEFSINSDDVKNGLPEQPDICPTANGVIRSSGLGPFIDGVEIGTTRVLLISWLERVTLKFYVPERLRQQITLFDRFHKWLELGNFTLDPLPPSLRRGYRSPGLVAYPRGVRRPRGRRLVFRVDGLTHA